MIEYNLAVIIMKTVSKIFLLIVIICGTLVAQVDPKEIVKNDIERLLRYTKQNNIILAARLIAYKGNDADRNLKDAVNPENEEELKHAKRIVKKLNAFLDLSDTYEFGEFQKKSDKTGDYFIQEVKFKKGQQLLSTDFTFINFQGRYLLTDFE